MDLNTHNIALELKNFFLETQHVVIRVQSLLCYRKVDVSLRILFYQKPGLGDLITRLPAGNLNCQTGFAQVVRTAEKEAGGLESLIKSSKNVTKTS